MIRLFDWLYKLSPCPICHTIPSAFKNHKFGYYVRCSNCGMGTMCYNTRLGATRSWNFAAKE